MVACIHAENGRASADALRRTFGESEIQARTGYSAEEIIHACDAVKTKALKKIKKKTPSHAVRQDVRVRR